MKYLLQHSSAILLIDYFGFIVGVSLLECIFPLRGAGELLRTRWIGNIGVGIVDFIVIRLLFPTLGIATAMISGQRGWGLFSHVHVPLWAEALLAIPLLDLIAYSQHRLFHRLTFLWRIHRTHHSDQDFDFSTAFRFHPLEAILETLTNLAAIAVLAPHLPVVFVAQILSTSQSFLEHGNIQMPARLERILRIAFVTSGMHRIHHSQDDRECLANFSFIFSWWDRLFNTYVEHPKLKPEAMSFGVAEFQARKHQTLPWIIAQPFLGARDEFGGQTRNSEFEGQTRNLSR